MLWNQNKKKINPIRMSRACALVILQIHGNKYENAKAEEYNVNILFEKYLEQKLNPSIYDFKFDFHLFEFTDRKSRQNAIDYGNLIGDQVISGIPKSFLHLKTLTDNEYERWKIMESKQKNRASMYESK
jgi:hypothetical protein